jgi:hypothetical protein
VLRGNCRDDIIGIGNQTITITKNKKEPVSESTEEDCWTSAAAYINNPVGRTNKKVYR